VFSLRKEYRSALSEFDTAARYTPKSGSILLSRATVLLKVGKYPDAIAALGRAYELSPRDPELLHTFAVAHQLSGSIHSGSGYHLAAIEVADDSAAYLIGPFADAVVLDAELSVQSDRVASACRQRLKRQPDDYETMYRLSRLLQVTGKPLDALELLGKAETILRAAVQRDPRNARAMLYLALTLTRQGKFPEAAALAVKAAAIDKRNPEVKYMMAQMYSLQMYSQREKKIDENTKEAALKALREAIEGSYRFDEIASADFYNLFERPEFRTAIQQAL
jgi:tetratricopeptide (TPR) repeat protein